MWRRGPECWGRRAAAQAGSTGVCRAQTKADGHGPGWLLDPAHRVNEGGRAFCVCGGSSCFICVSGFITPVLVPNTNVLGR